MSDDEDYGGIGGFGGLNKVIMDTAGIDPSSLGNFSTLFSKSSAAGPSKRASGYDDIDIESGPVRYMDDEFADDELPADPEAEMVRQRREREEERMIRRTMAMQKRYQSGAAEAERKRKAAKAQESAGDLVRRVWPEHQIGKRLKMSEIFYENPGQVRSAMIELQNMKKRSKERVEHRFKVAPLPSTTPLATFLEAGLPPLLVAEAGKAAYETRVGHLFDAAWVREAKARRRKEMRRLPQGLSLEERNVEAADTDLVERTLDLADWENDIVFSSLGPDGSRSIIPEPSPAHATRNEHIESGDWLKDVIWDATLVLPGLVESDDEEVKVTVTQSAKTHGDKPTAKLDPFNLSNDHLYEQARDARYRIRQTFGSIEVFHSGPARNLQLPFYKTSLNKTEARAWKRPTLQFPVGIPLSFSKLKANPSAAARTKRKAMVADPSERFKSTKDLTMSEKGPYVLLEFSEEYPPIMSGYGMGTTIVNYYRKMHDKDETVPKLDIGQPSILNTGDAEPYLLGYVDRGKVTQVIHNNLIRAPIFRHTPETTDFLVVRTTIGGNPTYHLRGISNLYTVGQTVPNQSEVPGPHARKSTTTAKQRLQIIAWLLIQSDKQKKIKLDKLVKYFPDQSELQMRQRLKIKGNEFLLYSRDPGPNQGHWILNPNFNWPKERKEVLEQCTPEMAMLYEAMQVGARHLHDAGYSKSAEGKEDDEMNADDPTELDVEQQLAVWRTTLNYKKAEGQKAWLVVHGPGEPTGRGEGFSFLTTNMKGYFLRKGETEQGRRMDAERLANGNEVKISNALQSRIYEEEKRFVWDLQTKALSDPNPPELSAADEAEHAAPTPAASGPRSNRADSRRAFSRANSMAMTPAFESPRDGSPSAWSADGESAYTGNNNNNRILRISRTDKSGKSKVTIIRDPAVITMYLKRKEEERLAYYISRPGLVDELVQPTGNPEEDEIRRKALRLQIEKAKKNQERRRARKKHMKGELEVFEGDETGKRRCGACGMVGHTKANRMCPKYQASVAPSPAGTTPTAATPGGYGMPFREGMGAAESAAPTSLKIRLGTGARPQ